MEDTGGKPPQALEREELINSIVAENNLRFEQSLGKDHPRAISDEALRALIPKSLYRVSLDPRKVFSEIWDIGNQVEMDVIGSSLGSDKTPALSQMMDCRFELLRSRPKTLVVRDFGVRRNIQGSGIGTDFYSRLGEISRILGFRFIIGQNNSQNIGFFQGKLGRISLLAIDRDLWEEIIPVKEFHKTKTFNPGMTTVHFLNPEDQSAFLSAKTPV